MLVGVAVGLAVGNEVGIEVGTDEGLAVGEADGIAVGGVVGDGVGAQMIPLHSGMTRKVKSGKESYLPAFTLRCFRWSWVRLA